MAHDLFFQSIRGFESEQAALQKWADDHRPLAYVHRGTSYTVLVQEKGKELAITCNDTKYIYHRDAGVITFKKQGDAHLSWEQIIREGRGKTIRFHISDSTPYIQETILFIAFSSLAFYSAIKIKKRYFADKPVVQPRQKIPSRF
ncbi:MAG: hypothetical protein KDK64_08365 [Chlamydiia bacterium]|nr:hypothetical protein [Chlamydiia bacterium]